MIMWDDDSFIQKTLYGKDIKDYNQLSWQPYIPETLTSQDGTREKLGVVDLTMDRVSPVKVL